MSPRRPATKTLIVLCLLVFQAQLYAAAVLGCRHGGAEDPGIAAACLYHRAPFAPAESDPLVDCHKCALHLGVGGAIQLGPPLASFLAPMRSATEPTPGRHFYCFVPESPFRPPIS